MRLVDLAQSSGISKSHMMLHRLRAVLVRPGRDRLTGTVEVDETYIGGEEPGLRGGRARGKKVLVCIAIEVFEPRGFGRCRMQTLTDASAQSLHAFITKNVEPGAHLITDGWTGYRGIDKLGYTHERRSQRATQALGQDPGKLLPGVHRVAALVKRWLLGTHQSSVDPAHLQSYLNEFVFRFNRRRSRARGMLFYRVLQLAVDHAPVRYRELVADPKPKRVPPRPPNRRGHPPSLDRARYYDQDVVQDVRQRVGRGRDSQAPADPRQAVRQLLRRRASRR